MQPSYIIALYLRFVHTQNHQHQKTRRRLERSQRNKPKPNKEAYKVPCVVPPRAALIFYICIYTTNHLESRWRKMLDDFRHPLYDETNKDEKEEERRWSEKKKNAYIQTYRMSIQTDMERRRTVSIEQREKEERNKKQGKRIYIYIYVQGEYDRQG